MLLNFNLNQHISFSTHNSSHILDFIKINTSSKLTINSNLIDTYISDHKTVNIDLDILKPVAQKSSFTFRPLNKIYFTDLNNNITAAFSNFEHHDLNSLVSHYNSTLSSLLDKHTPEKTVDTTRSSNLWFTPYLLHERQKRRQLERTWCKSHSDNDRLLYLNQYQLHNSLWKKAQSIYFSSLFVNCSDSKSLWHSTEKVLRSLTSNTDPPASLSAHQFNYLFTDKTKSLRANLPLSDVNLFPFLISLHLFFLHLNW